MPATVRAAGVLATADGGRAVQASAKGPRVLDVPTAEVGTRTKRATDLDEVETQDTDAEGEVVSEAKASEPGGAGVMASPVEHMDAVLPQEVRFVPTARPAVPGAQHPLASTPANVDTDKPVHEWQRATDDWRGVRPWLEDHGLSLNATLQGEFAKSVLGGNDTRHVATGIIFDANLTIDLEKLITFKGGTFFVNFQNETGARTSMDGAVQDTSDATAEGRTQISECWYEQVFGEGKVRIKVGKIDANTEFSNIGGAADFLNGAMAYSPTIMGFPTHPDPAIGILGFIYPAKHLYAGIGAFDGSSSAGEPTGAHGFPLRGISNFFLIAEAGATWEIGKLQGKAGAGVWHLTGSLERFDGGKEPGATGPYFFVDQVLWKQDEARESDRGFVRFWRAGMRRLP